MSTAEELDRCFDSLEDSDDILRLTREAITELRRHEDLVRILRDELYRAQTNLGAARAELLKFHAPGV